MPDRSRPGLEAAIASHLRAAGGLVSSRDLAARFLAIGSADEATCERLLAPVLTGQRGVRRVPGSGWRFEAAAGAAPAAAGRAEEPVDPQAIDAHGGAPASEGPGEGPAPMGLLDFVALAADGAGPGGSGVVRAVTLLPVVEGEELQEESLPAWALDEEGYPVGAGEGDEGGDNQGGDAVLPRPRRGATLAAGDLEALAETVGDLPIVTHRVGREVEPLRRAAAAAGLPFHPRVISAARLGNLLLGLKANHAPGDLARALAIEAHGPDDCRGRARLVARAYLRLVPRLEEIGIRTIDGLIAFQDLPAEPVDFSRFAFTQADLQALPAAPGVYRFRDRDGLVIYVGKAKNLRLRVASYFMPGASKTPKGRAVLEQAHRLEYDGVASELEAILLEAAGIAAHRPRLNRQFEVHDRTPPYGPRTNLVVVLADDAGSGCTLHLTRGGRYLRALPVGGAGEEWSAVEQALAVYFEAAVTDANSGAVEPAVDLDWPLLSSFLRRHRDATNILDVDECADAREACTRVRTLVAATLSGARVVAR
jgi:hypothetical protein